MPVQGVITSLTEGDLPTTYYANRPAERDGIQKHPVMTKTDAPGEARTHNLRMA